jgi:hypothetical protein
MELEMFNKETRFVRKKRLSLQKSKPVNMGFDY